MNNRLSSLHSSWLAYDVSDDPEHDCPECGAEMECEDGWFACPECGETVYPDLPDRLEREV